MYWIHLIPLAWHVLLMSVCLVISSSSKIAIFAYQPYGMPHHFPCTCCQPKSTSNLLNRSTASHAPDAQILKFVTMLAFCTWATPLILLPHVLLSVTFSVTGSEVKLCTCTSKWWTKMRAHHGLLLIHPPGLLHVLIVPFVKNGTCHTCSQHTNPFNSGDQKLGIV